MQKFRPNVQTEKASFSPKKRTLILLIATLLVVIISGLYLHNQWHKYQKTASTDAIRLAQSLESMLHPEHIAKLKASAEDIKNPEYTTAKAGLIRLVKATDSIRLAYIMAERDGQLVFLMDSESPESPDYSPPGRVYGYADEWVLEPFKTGETVITPPITGRRGTWISALVPIKDSESREINAVFGIDFSAAEWNAGLRRQILLNITVVVFVLLLYFAFLYILLQLLRLNRLNRKLAFDEALYRGIFDQAPMGVAIVENKSFIYQSSYGHGSINPMFEKILGRSSSELSKVAWPEITHPDDLQADLEKFDQFIKGTIDGYTMEKRFIRPDGEIVWTHMSISPLSDIYDNHSRHLCLIKDISERKQAELALEESERKQSILLSHLPGLAYRCNYDRDGTMLIVSDGCYNLTGYLPESFINNRDLPFNNIILPEYRQLLWSEWERAAENKQPYSCEYEITTAAGERKWVLEVGQAIYNDRDETEALEGMILDISGRKKLENHLRYISEHDMWTNLYNRDYLVFILEKDIKKKDGLKRAVISINLSTVQLLTANYGFNYTQNLIKAAAESLGGYCTSKRSLFQTYENRFVFYLVDYKDKNELLDFCDSIAGALDSIFVTDRIGGGIGVLEIEQTDTEVDVDLLLKRLIIASERSISHSDKDFSVCFYDEELDARVNREADIRQALSEIATDDSGAELFLQYQPIIDSQTNSVVGFEALARLKTEKLGPVSPVEFIPIAEETKFIIPIGEKVFINAFHFLNKLKKYGYDEIGVSINVSAIQLVKPDFTDRLFELISELQVSSENIGIEITESVFTSDYKNINSIIEKLKAAGMHISIDDFGTGYSSLAREEELNVDFLKIDKYFIDKLLDKDLSKVITSDIISMAHKLGHYAVAEGVEHESQLRYLKEHGCDRIQGYLISKPLDEEDAFEFLKKQG